MAPTVLIVEDDEATRNGLEELLKDAGYDTLAVGTFEAGSRALKWQAPDLLIVDVRLGAFNGLHLIVTNPNPVPAIVITGFPDSVLETEARQRGAEYLVKPIEPSELLSLVRERLEHLPGSDQFRPPRRWARKHVSGGLPAHVEDEPARILDLSYGGLRFEIDRTYGRPLPSSVNVTLIRSRITVMAALVWTNPTGEGSWVCGASVSQANPSATREWCGLVDAIP